jgi:hypothetical protein
MKNTIKLLLLLFTANIFGQNMAKRELLAKRFVRDARTHLVMDTIIWKEQNKVFNQLEKNFTDYGLDITVAEDYNYFLDKMEEQFRFLRDHIYKQIIYTYQHRNYDEVQKYIAQIQAGKRRKVIHTSGLYPLIKKLLTKEINDVYKYSIPKYLEIIKRRREPVPLVLKVNNKKVTPKEIGLKVFVITNNFDYTKVNILDEEKSLLLKPKGYTYKQIQKILVEYKGKKFIFKPDDSIKYLPKNLAELNNLMSKYSFEQIPEWKMEVNEDKKKIEVKMESVIESSVIKVKQKAKFKAKLD